MSRKRCPVCGKEGCFLALTASGWPQVTNPNIDFGDGFLRNTIRVKPDSRPLPTRRDPAAGMAVTSLAFAY